MRFSVDAMRRIYLEGAGLTDIWFNFIPMIIPNHYKHVHSRMAI